MDSSPVFDWPRDKDRSVLCGCAKVLANLGNDAVGL